MATQAARPARAGSAATIDPGEVRAFSALADRWWDPQGPFAPLHRLNPVRLAWLRRRLVGHFGLDGESAAALDGLAIADIGCGGGLATEPLARLGARMTGIDASAEAIAAARAHAGRSGLRIDYREGAVETLAETGERFDAVVALEIVEHVADRAAFVAACRRCARPGGLLLFATLNRTLRAWALAILGAEYALRWVPRGTHRWSRFVRPSELAQDLRAGGAQVVDVTGLVFDPLANRWSAGRDLSVNYMLAARAPGGDGGAAAGSTRPQSAL